MPTRPDARCTPTRIVPAQAEAGGFGGRFDFAGLRRAGGVLTRAIMHGVNGVSAEAPGLPG
jgi:hypothetical protein